MEDEMKMFKFRRKRKQMWKDEKFIWHIVKRLQYWLIDILNLA